MDSSLQVGTPTFEWNTIVPFLVGGENCFEFQAVWNAAKSPAWLNVNTFPTSHLQFVMPAFCPRWHHQVFFLFTLGRAPIEPQKTLYNCLYRLNSHPFVKTTVSNQWRAPLSHFHVCWLNERQHRTRLCIKKTHCLLTLTDVDCVFYFGPLYICAFCFFFPLVYDPPAADEPERSSHPLWSCQREGQRRRHSGHHRQHISQREGHCWNPTGITFLLSSPSEYLFFL